MYASFEQVVIRASKINAFPRQVQPASVRLYLDNVQVAAAISWCT